MANIVICCGIQRSGSTWTYQVVSELLKNNNSTNLGFHDGKLHTILNNLDEGSSEYYLLKMHNYPGDLEYFTHHHEFYFIYSHRDLRGVIYSVMQKDNHDFNEVIKMNFLRKSINALFDWNKHENILYIPFNQIIASKPEEVNKIANFINVNNYNPEDIATKYSLGNQKIRIKRFNSKGIIIVKKILKKFGYKGVPYDKKSLLHYNHITTGSETEWKQNFSIAESDAVFNEFNEWMNFFKYSR